MAARAHQLPRALIREASPVVPVLREEVMAAHLKILSQMVTFLQGQVEMHCLLQALPSLMETQRLLHHLSALQKVEMVA